MYSKRNEDNIPIKIGGWDGKFVYEKPSLKDGYEFVKPSRGTLERQQWQEGKKEIIKSSYENQKSTMDSKHTTNISSQSREHTIHVETEAQNFNHGQQKPYSYSNVHLENENQSGYNDQQQYHRDQQQQQQKTSDAANLHGYHTETETLPPENISDASQLYGYSREPTILPAQWDGKFPEGYRSYRPKPDQNRSSANNMYGFSTDPTILPTQWDGKFVKSGETFLVSDRNQSATNNFYDYDNTPTVLPTTWNGEFQLDKNDVRIKPERNASDLRDYADHRRFVTRE